MLSYQNIKKILRNFKIISDSELEELKEKLIPNERLENFLIRKKIITENDLYQKAADFFNLPFINLKRRKIENTFYKLLPEIIIITHQFIPFHYESKKKFLEIATPKIQNPEILRYLQNNFKINSKIYLTTPNSFQNKIKDFQRYFKIKNNYNSYINTISSQKKIYTIPHLVNYAIDKEKTNILIEKKENSDVEISFRKQDLENKKIKLKNKKRLAKDLITLKENDLNNLKIENNNEKIDLHISYLDKAKNKIHIKILKNKIEKFFPPNLGITRKNWQLIKKYIEKKQGLIIINGEEKSGTTTTLYSILNYLHLKNKKSNIYSIENKTSIIINNINQISLVKQKTKNIEKILNAIFKQNPDILFIDIDNFNNQNQWEKIMEKSIANCLIIITQKETTTNLLTEKFKKLKLSKYLIKRSLKLIINQKLVSKNCPYCLKKIKLEKTILNKINNIKKIPNLINIFEKNKLIPSKTEKSKKLNFYKNTTCLKCKKTGKDKKIALIEIFDLAKKEKTYSLLEDAFMKAQNAIINPEDIFTLQNSIQIN